MARSSRHPPVGSAAAAAALLVLAFTVATSTTGVNADIYMHNPRGSNDRNCERNVNRNNGNRLFDSQNNAKGGYACPRAVGDASVQAEDGTADRGGVPQDKKMYFYEGSKLAIEWTNQHGCGKNSKVNCEIIIQYMCEDTADPQGDGLWPSALGKREGDQHFRSGNNIGAPRDGIPRDANDAATDTIPDNEQSARANTEETQRFGMHESYDFYQECQHTERNEGLYTADQWVRRTDRRGTRQNPNGNRRGLECPEERDYYPWWAPSPWIDIAVLTNEGADSNRCAYYKANSFNTNAKGFCEAESAEAKTNSQLWQQRRWPNNKDACEAAGFEWKEFALADLYDEGLPEVDCGATQFSRVNQLGNAVDTTVVAGTEDGAPQAVNANRYIWTIPKIPTPSDAAPFDGHAGNGLEDAYKSCTLRVRYNVSTSDFAAWPAEAVDDDHPWRGQMVDAANNTDGSDYSNTPLQQDPYITIGHGDSDGDGEAFVSLAVNTNQYARTFQDRSYTFKVVPRPTVASPASDQTDAPAVPASALVDPDATIWNVNVRGKRGNIVQTYPAVEYDFVPNSLSLGTNDIVHFQWTGSDYNPRRGCNDAEGGPPDPNTFVNGDNQNARADRSNMVFLNSMAENVPMDMLGASKFMLDDGDEADSFSFASKVAAAREATEDRLPCFDEDGDNVECYEQALRLAYLNQQSDELSLEKRNNRACLTAEELDQINDKNERETHPLNCAKLNAKPYPYYDGGLMSMKAPGSWSFFSSRNNNFSNRDQTGNICVAGPCTTDACRAAFPITEVATCDLAPGSRVLQDVNPMISTASQQEKSRCHDEANAGGRSGQANDQGAASCVENARGDGDILDGETQTTEQAGNDAFGDGDAEGCRELTFEVGRVKTTAEKVTLAIGLLFLGIGTAWGSYYTYNRVQRSAQQRNAKSAIQKFGGGGGAPRFTTTANPCAMNAALPARRASNPQALALAGAI